MARYMQSIRSARRLLLLHCVALLPIAAVFCASEEVPATSAQDALERSAMMEVFEDQPKKQKELSPKDMERAVREVAMALKAIGDQLDRKYMRGAKSAQNGDPVTAMHQDVGRQMAAAGDELNRKAKLRKGEGAPVAVKDLTKDVQGAMSSLYSSVMDGIFRSFMRGNFFERSPIMEVARHAQSVTASFLGRGGRNGEKDVPVDGVEGVSGDNEMSAGGKTEDASGAATDDVGEDAGTAAAEKVAEAAALAEDGETDGGDGDAETVARQVAKAAGAALTENGPTHDGTAEDVGDDAGIAEEVYNDAGRADDVADDAGIANDAGVADDVGDDGSME